MGFYGATGWFIDLPLGKDIPDQSIYLNQSKNIPCKIKKDSDLKDDSVRKETEQKNITFKF